MSLGDSRKNKSRLLRLWAKMQREIEKRLGLILVLFLLNWFTICWLNLHKYGT